MRYHWGRGPAGLTAAYELSENGADAVVLEQDPIVERHCPNGRVPRATVSISGAIAFSAKRRLSMNGGKTYSETTSSLDRGCLRIHYSGKFFDYPYATNQCATGLGRSRR